MLGRNDQSALLANARLEVPDASAVRRAVADRLRSAIRVGEMPGGTRLLQTQLADQLGVSRMPVRDAIGDLVAEGLAVPMPGGGAVVSELSRNDMHDVYAVRTSLEIHAVRDVCRLDDVSSLVKDLQAILEEAQPHIANGALEKLTELDKSFHWAIYRATGNRFLEMALTPMWAQVDRIMYAILLLPQYLSTAWDEHAAIVGAIEARDGERAAVLMREHLSLAAERLISRAAESAEA